MRKEISIYVNTTVEDEELKISSCSDPELVVLTFLNGVKLGVSLNDLSKALFEVEYFKMLNTPNQTTKELNVSNNGAKVELLND
jgi:hypothetical protein